MSDTIQTFYVTNTSCKVSTSGDNAYEPKEGSLAWAIEQAGMSGEPSVIIFTKALSGKTIKLGTEYDGYGSSSYITSDLTFRMEEGAKPVTLTSVKYEPGYDDEPSHIFGSLTVEDGITINANLSIEGTLALDGNSIGGTVYLEGNCAITGKDITFTNETPFELYLRPTYGSGVDSAAWDGTKESLQAALDKVLGEADYTLTADKPILRLEVGDGFSQDVVISNEWQATVVPEGFSGLELGFYLCNGETVTIAKGTTLLTTSYSALFVDGATLNIEPGANITNADGHGPEILVYDGALNIDGVDLKDGYIYSGGGHINISNCWGTKAKLNLGAAESIRITNCDLSRMTLSVDEYDLNNWEGSTINLSGNYWGTTSLSTIMKKFTVYDYELERDVPLDESYFYSEENPSGIIDLGVPLSAAPAKPDYSAPTLKLGTPTIANASEGVADVTFTWTGKGDGVTYTLLVNGEELASGLSENSFTVEGLTDSESLRYTVIATNKYGISTTEASSFTFDATAPELSLLGETITSPKNGKAKVTLRWEASEANVTYTLVIDGKQVYSGPKTEYTASLNDGEHTCTITATDKAGNSSSTEGTFSFDATAPVVKLLTPTVVCTTQGAGGDVTLHVSSNEEGVTYTLTLNGKEVELSDPASADILLKGLADGKYKYTITATDASGNVSKKQSGNFVVDSSDLTPPAAPELKAVTPKVKGVNKIDIALSWIAPEKGLSYIITGTDATGNEVSTVTSKSNTYTFKGMADGTYSFAITAVDKAGNVGEALEINDITVDSIAPEITALEHIVVNGETGSNASELRLAWIPPKDEDECSSYIVKVAGKTYTFTKNAKGTYVATAKVDGEEQEIYLYKGTDGRLAFFLPVRVKDGKYSYSVTAVDASGNKKEFKSTEPAITDTKAPSAPRLNKPVLVSDDGMVLATLSWKGEAGATYKLVVDGEEITLEDPQATSCTVRLEDGVEHSYSVQAWDAADNTDDIKSVAKSKPFSHDATAPAIALSGGDLLKYTATKATISLRWECGESKGITYRLVDLDTGKQLYKGSKANCKVDVTEGVHTYELIATDKAGNSTTITNQLRYDSSYGVEWVAGSTPTTSDTIGWSSTDTDGIRGTLSSVGETFYTLRIEAMGSATARTNIRLDANDSALGINLYDQDGIHFGAAKATPGTALDQELSLYSGTYYLQVTGAAGSEYTLDVELTNGDNFKQGTLA